MSFSPAQLATLEAVIRTSSSISLICASAILVDVARKWSQISASPNRMVIWWIIASIIPGPFVIIGRSELPKPGTYPNAACWIQGIAIAYGFVSSAIWAGCMACNIYLVICRKWAMEAILRVEWVYHVLAWIIPLVLAIFPIFLQPLDALPSYYGDAGLWCWVSVAFSPWRFLYLGAIWASFIFSIIVYIAVGIQVRLRMIVNEPASGNKASGSTSSRNRFVIMTSLYIGAFFMTYIGASINRLASLVGVNSYALYILQGITQPCVGIFAAIAYFGRYFFTCVGVMRSTIESRSVPSKGQSSSKINSECDNTRASSSVQLKPKSKNDVAGQSWI